jgi:hypothetical protein
MVAEAPAVIASERETEALAQAHSKQEQVEQQQKLQGVGVTAATRTEAEPEPEPEPGRAFEGDMERPASTFTVVCPEGCVAGDPVLILVGEAEMEVNIPEGVAAGVEFDVEIPLVEQANDSNHGPDNTSTDDMTGWQDEEEDVEVVLSRIADLEELLDTLTDMSDGVSDDDLELVAQELHDLQNKLAVLAREGDAKTVSTENSRAVADGTANEQANQQLAGRDGAERKQLTGTAKTKESQVVRMGAREFVVLSVLLILASFAATWDSVELQQLYLAGTSGLDLPGSSPEKKEFLVAKNPTLGVPLDDLPPAVSAGPTATAVSVPFIFDKVRCRQHGFHVSLDIYIRDEFQLQLKCVMFVTHDGRSWLGLISLMLSVVATYFSFTATKLWLHR